MKKTILIALAAFSSLTATFVPASAGDDAIDCEELWVMRNQIFKDNGYCFKTSKAINYFGNAGCEYDSEAAVPLSKNDRRKINKIRSAERRQGC